MLHNSILHWSIWTEFAMNLKKPQQKWLQIELFWSQTDVDGQKITVNEIAAELGYDDYSYQKRFFKKHTGMTPTALEFLNKD
jgi:AraC-like DNA-binding protein